MKRLWQLRSRPVEDEKDMVIPGRVGDLPSVRTSLGFRV